MASKNSLLWESLASPAPDFVAIVFKSAGTQHHSASAGGAYGKADQQGRTYGDPRSRYFRVTGTQLPLDKRKNVGVDTGWHGYFDDFFVGFRWRVFDEV